MKREVSVKRHIYFGIIYFPCEDGIINNGEVFQKEFTQMMIHDCFMFIKIQAFNVNLVKS